MLEVGPAKVRRASLRSMPSSEMYRVSPAIHFTWLWWAGKDKKGKTDCCGVVFAYMMITSQYEKEEERDEEKHCILRGVDGMVWWVSVKSKIKMIFSKLAMQIVLCPPFVIVSFSCFYFETPSSSCTLVFPAFNQHLSCPNVLHLCCTIFPLSV